ncbi:MAG: UDP-3-O-(3-hydroxymyristoyl)glucosamine N-acyltransferase, partial [Pseudomonadota bacterium]
MGGHTISDIAQALGLRAEGDLSCRVSGASEPASATQADLAIALDRSFAEGLAQGAAVAALMWDDADWQSYGLKAAILTPRGRFAMAGITGLLDPGPQIAPGIHPSAVIDPTAEIADGAAIAPLAVVGPHARIGANARIGSHVSIGAGAEIGENALLLDGVRIGALVHIGDRFIA